MEIELDCNILIARALETAARYHRGQNRKGDKNIPYIVHPVEVALNLQKSGAPPEVIAAGLLHDTLEDTDMKQDHLEELFGGRILKLVLGASEKLANRENTPWEERKEHTVRQARNVSREVKLIICADKLANVCSMNRDYQQIGDELWARFSRGYDEQKWYYESLVDSLGELNDLKIYHEFRSAVEILFATVSD